jgi:hypothetical protein
MKRAILFIILTVLAGCIQPQPTENQNLEGQNPVIRSVTATPPVIGVGQNCTVTCDAFDPLGDALTYKWQVNLGDIVGQGSTVNYSAAPCCAGVNRINVTVTNTRGGRTSGFVDVVVRL